MERLGLLAVAFMSGDCLPERVWMVNSHQTWSARSYEPSTYQLIGICFLDAPRFKSQFSGEGLVQQRLLQRLQHGVLPLVEAGEASGFSGVHRSGVVGCL